ncbi:hypothetical protein TYRP_010539, partial [Tyrophagus putrescentiae]
IYLEITRDICRGAELVLRSLEILLLHETETYTDSTGYRYGNGLLQLDLPINSEKQSNSSSKHRHSSSKSNGSTHHLDSISKDPLASLLEPLAASNNPFFWQDLVKGTSNGSAEQSLEQLFGLKSALINKYLNKHQSTVKEGFEKSHRSNWSESR